MKKYWFYLEPFTFLFCTKGEVLIYNSISYNSKVFKNISNLKELITSITEIENMYCIELNEEDIKDKAIENFIKYVHESFSGDLVNSEIIKRPVIFPPDLKLQFSISGLEKTSYRDIGEEVIKILKEVSIYIGGENPNSSLNNVNTFKQFDYCKKSDGIHLPMFKLRGILNSLKGFHRTNLNIIGGNVFSYPDLSELIANLNGISGDKYLYSTYKDIPHDLKLFSILKNSQIHIKVLIDFPVDIHRLELIIQSLFKKDLNLEFLFAITSVYQYNHAISIIEKFNLKHFEIKPVFTQHNTGFFEKYVYLNRKDLDQTQLSRNQIFLNQTINTQNFGRLRIMENGLVYPGFKTVSIGSINLPLIKLIHKELEKPNSWLKIRTQKPCKSCIYQWICPSPSSYELALGKPNLCHLTK